VSLSGHGAVAAGKANSLGVGSSMMIRMTCKQGVSGVLGGDNLAKHSQTVSFVCATLLLRS
jgi:hypothetical protein